MSPKTLRSAGRFASWMAVAAVIIQPQVLLAETPSNAAPVPMHVVDVELGPNGQLRGQLVDRQGGLLPIACVQLTNGHELSTVYTDEHGRFAFEGLVGSTYHLQAGEHNQLVRAWSEGTAPPAATKGLLIVNDSQVLLGQHCGSPVCGSMVCAAKHPLANPFILGGLVAAAVAIPVAIHNSDDDDDPATP